MNIQSTCPTCGNIFNRQHWQAPNASRHFCSKPCQNIGQSGGKHLDAAGYVIISNSGKPIKEHRAIMEAHIGRRLVAGEEVHHINGIKSDNRIENLVVLTRAIHRTQHLTTKIDIEKAKMLRDSGLPYQSIADALNVSRNALWTAFKIRGMLDTKRGTKSIHLPTA